MPAATRLELAIHRIRFARQFNKGFLAGLVLDEWLAKRTDAELKAPLERCTK